MNDSNREHPRSDLPQIVGVGSVARGVTNQAADTQ